MAQLSASQIDDLLAAMRERLGYLESEISRKLGDSADELISFDHVGDAGDLSQAVTNSEIDLSEAMRDIAEWRGLRAALGRAGQNTYGVCTECGVEIPYERLRVQPLAARCIGCQARAERSRGGLTPTHG